MAGSVLVVVVCGVVSARVSRKPAPPVAAAEPVPARVAPTDFASLARSLAKEEGQARALSPPPEEKPVETKPVEAPPAPPEVKAVSISSSTPRDKGGGRRSRRKSPSPSTVPPPLGTPSVPTADERDAANRFGEVNGREARLATSTGSIARSTPAQGDISHVITNNRQGIQTCYQRALLRDTSLTHGKVTVRVSIGLSGKVKSVSLDAPAQFRALEPCIRDVMSRWAFPPSSEEYGTEFPVVLQGNQ